MDRRFLFLIVAAGLFAGILAWRFADREKIANYPSAGETIIAFGDSLTVGEGVATTDTYVAALSDRLGIPVVNAGVSGDTTADALARLTQVLAEYPRPKLAIVMLGGNDFLQHRPKEETAQNLGRIIERFQTKGAMVVLVGVRGGIFTDAFAPEYERLHRAYRTAYVPNILEGILGDPSLKVDAIHPNAAGHRKMAGRLEPVIQSLLR